MIVEEKKPYGTVLLKQIPAIRTLPDKFVGSTLGIANFFTLRIGVDFFREEK